MGNTVHHQPPAANILLMGELRIASAFFYLLPFRALERFRTFAQFAPAQPDRIAAALIQLTSASLSTNSSHSCPFSPKLCVSLYTIEVIAKKTHTPEEPQS